MYVKEIERLHAIRKLEIDLVTKTLTDKFRGKFASILEIGSGDGFQLNHLSKLGKVYGTDVHLSSRFPHSAGSEYTFLLANSEQIPFRDRTFDLIFSSNVIEHIVNKEAAFREMLRVGKQDCLFVHTVPTSYWKALSIITYYLYLPKKVLNKLKRMLAKDGSILNTATNHQVSTCSPFVKKKIWTRILSIIFPAHGTAENGIKELNEFRKSNWKSLFESYFHILKIQDLALYSSPGTPIVPATTALNSYGISSCVAFFMSRK